MDRIIVVGNGPAAKLVAECILEHSPDVPLTVFGSATSHNIDLRLGVTPVAIDRFARTVVADDGSRTGFYRLILASFGLACTLARDAKLHVRKGVLVNAHLQTSDGYIYAVGDCAESESGAPLPPLEQQAHTVSAHINASSHSFFALHDLAIAI